MSIALLNDMFCAASLDSVFPDILALQSSFKVTSRKFFSSCADLVTGYILFSRRNGVALSEVFGFCFLPAKTI